MNLDDLIEYDEEGTNLDFKKEEYKKENYLSLIKDIMSMANALNTEKKRIVIGVKHNPGEEKEFHGIDTIVDQSTFENVIQENIEPNINFKYYSYNFKGTKLGILEILDNTNKPYMMKKDYNTLKKGDMWIRKGSRQSKVTREDIDRMFDFRKKTVFSNKVSVGFGKKLKNKISMKKSNINFDEFPSQIRKKELEALLNRLNEKYHRIEEVENSQKGSILDGLGLGFFSEFNDSEKSIRVGSNEFGLPVYQNREELQKNIDTIKSDYFANDNYYCYEKNSEKINLALYNDGTEFLEDVLIEFYFDSNIFDISPKVFDEPKSLFDMNSSFNFHNYPEVVEENNIFIVKEHHDKIRHKVLTDIFCEDVRAIILPNTESVESEVKYRIGAKNLSKYIEGSVFILIE